MQEGATFAEVLDGFLHPHAPGTPVQQSQAPVRPAPASPFLFSTAYRRAPASLPRDYVTVGDAGPAAPRAARSRRSLTAVQQRSFDALIALGANLTSDFTAQELRAAFRALARRYHPDRHPFADAAEVTILARTFTAITGHVELLRTLAETSTH